MSRDWLGVLEAAYRIELPEDAWLDGILVAARPILEHKAGIAALLYDASAPRLGELRFATAGTPDGFVDAMQPIRAAADPAKLFGTLACSLISRTFVREFPRVLDRLRPFGIVDMLVVNGIDPTLRGCCLIGNLSPTTPSALASRTRAMWTRVSAHLAAAYRLRRHPAQVEAVFATDGTVRHAEGRALEPTAIEALREAVLLRDNARTRLRHHDPDAAIGAWKGLVDAQWSLIDLGDGTVAAHANEAARSIDDKLQPRERQVAAYVALGHPTKMIAYTLGLPTATVAALVGRACKRLGIDGRAALAREYAKRSKPTELH
jgi:DNA-binding CsgD family transcriptional regulator